MQYDGVVQWVRFVDYDGEPVEQVDDITDEVNALYRAKKKAEKDLAAVRKELADFRNKGHWTEMSIVQDRATGLAAVVRTDYRLRAEHMRVEFDPMTQSAYPSAGTLAEGYQ